MKFNYRTLALIGFITIGFASSVQAASAMKWTCSGTDLTNEIPVQFELVLADHDGSDFTYKALENFFYNGQKTEGLDLSLEIVSCGPNKNGSERQGQQYWNLIDGNFNLYSGCENEALEIEAICREI